MSTASTAAQTLEVRAVGTVADGSALEELTQLLVALSGAQPAPLEQLEVVLRPPTAATEAGSTVPAGWKPDLRLQHDLTPHGAASSGAAAAAAGDSWDVLQFSLNLRGKQYAALAATVRHATRTRCTGDNVPAFWRSLGFAPRFQLLRRGSRFWVPLGGQEVEVTVCHVLRLPATAEGTTSSSAATIDAAALQRAEDVSPARLLVEAVACAAADADPLETAAAVGQLAALLQPHTVLQRPPRAPGEPA
ncbi:mediator of RNA polymerase II transcription subunit 18 isoform X1 [Chlorella sorokiniana]|uniref:Mediator of RNA polymerase II transcription subunit 18 isoform X1 n=1 Tax=Chlorella sorokiniana TaxID=3076 RepID=A0A2P6TX27_CHLSO|nr:mediator of RNA polymerase II transcription subunit 18 isoform X1 [Chlorella sorokiniana]|eukprot:PRW58601.1 mediator of RNA polymerase II transcription subunit 18 isoform X1 [Chlorella sorokiniana]